MAVARHFNVTSSVRRSQWSRGLRRAPATGCLLGLRVRIPPPLGTWISVSCGCCVFKSLRRADHSSGGVLPSGVCLNVLPKPRQWVRLDTAGLSKHEPQKM